MRRLHAKSVPLNPKDLIKRAAAEKDAGLTLTEPTALYSGNKLVAIYDEPFREGNVAAGERGILRAIKNHLSTLHYEKNTRSGGLKTHSRIFGYSPRNALRRKHYCGPTRMVAEQEPMLPIIDFLARTAARVYRQYVPETYFKHVSLADKVDSRYRIGGTPFTSGIINKSNALKYHYDAGNFENVYSCMFVFHVEHPQGGSLVLPEYNVKFQLADASLFLFDGQSIIHGVTPIDTSKGDRFSLVFYSLKQMWKCQEITQELLKARKAERHQLRADNRKAPK